VNTNNGVKRRRFIVRAVHESIMTVESRVESRVIAFSRDRVPIRVESRVLSLEYESSRVIAKVSRVIIAQLVVGPIIEVTSKVKGISNNLE